MVDHIYEPSLLKKASNYVATAITHQRVYLAAYRGRPTFPLDEEDVTRIQVNDIHGIVQIGKGLRTWNALDCGFFVCTPVIFSALQESVTRGKYQLSDGIQVLAQWKKSFIVPIEPCWWIDVDSEKEAKWAESKLFQQLKKATDGPVSRFVNRPISLKISRWLASYAITPNQISFFAFLLGVIAGFFVLTFKPVGLIIAGVLLQWSSILDGCDGEIARLKFLSSDFGAWIDAVMDRYVDAWYVACLAAYALYFHGDKLWITTPETLLWISLANLSGVLLNSYTADKYDHFLKKRSKGALRLGRDARLFLLSLGSVLLLPMVTLGFVALLSHLEVLRRVILLFRTEVLS